jgi:uncharacterized damage-inducible protein DinB
MQEALTRLFAHMRWADQQVLEQLKTAEEVHEPLKFYAHVLAAERLWYLRIHEENWTVVPVWPDFTLEQCEAMASENAALYEKLIPALTPEMLSKPVPYKNTAGSDYRNTVGDMLLHLALHGQHHRGQIAHAMRRHGDTPPIVDYIAWVRD